MKKLLILLFLHTGYHYGMGYLDILEFWKFCLHIVMFGIEYPFFFEWNPRFFDAATNAGEGMKRVKDAMERQRK